MLVLWSDGYLCDPDCEFRDAYLGEPEYEVTGICVILIMKWRVSLWARCEVTGICVIPIMKWRVSVWARCEVTGICVSPIMKWRVSVWAQ